MTLGPVAAPSPGWPPDDLLWKGGAALLIVFLMFAAYWFFYQRLMQPPAGVHVLRDMDFTAREETERSAVKQPRRLPDDWLQSSPRTLAGSYSASIEANVIRAKAADDLRGIYLPVARMNTDIYLDGRLLGRGHYFSTTRDHGDPYARETHRPLYFLIPGDLPARSHYTLRLEVEADQPGSGLLGPVYIGADTVLKSAWQNRYRARISNVQMITAGMLSIAIFMTVLWWLRREDSVYGWFALLVYTWAVHNIFLLGVDTPLPAAVEDWISLVTLGWFVVFMAITTRRYLGVGFDRLEKTILLVAVLGSLLLAFANATGWAIVHSHRLWSTLVLALGGYTLGRVALAYGHREDLKNPFVPAGGLSIMLLGTHDWLLVMGVIPRDGGLLLHLSAPITLITFASLLLERFSGVLREAESLNLQLEMRVAEKHRELKANFEKLREMENRQVLTEERERFMKEMHDGVGGHLIAMLSMMRGGESDPDKITRAIETTLSDLRIMIDSLEPDEHDIPALLGAMRTRLEPQLEHSRIRLEWQVSPIPPLPDFGPRKALQVMRILQEAISNVINHADARLMRIRACVVADDLGQQNAMLDIIDDGKGLVAENSRGRGLNNMRQRAASIGASLDIGPANPGTRVRLRLPYPPATQVRE